MKTQQRRVWRAASFVAAVLSAMPWACCLAQVAPPWQRDPHIGYVYPAGGQRGATFEVIVGGQYLQGVTGVHVPIAGLEATFVKYDEPLQPNKLNDLREKMEKVRDKVTEEMKAAGGMQAGFPAIMAKVKEEAMAQGVSEDELAKLMDYRKKRNDPKYQRNPQIEEAVTLRIRLAPDAPLGNTELRLRTSQGLSNPLTFQVSPWPEKREAEPNDSQAVGPPLKDLPVVMNGQILPGDVDRFRFQAEKGTRLVVAAAARELIPALADAVPGWFQATLSLSDASGAEIAYADDYRFSPDPVLFAEIPETGIYSIEIKDAVYRGREDFVYRIAVGAVPFVTSLFPLGGRAGAETSVHLEGWNLPVQEANLRLPRGRLGIRPVSVLAGHPTASRVPFVIGDLEETMEAEPNNDPATCQEVRPPVVINGRIGEGGDTDVVAFDCRAGGQIAAEVFARRLASPLDSVLKITNAKGEQLALNDDHEDPAAALVTHHADSRLQVKIPEDGRYYLHVGDRLSKGGSAFAYRLTINQLEADFQLRVVPSSVNARPGASVPITVYALRKDGFAGEIALSLRDAPDGCRLSGARVPAGQDKIRLTLTAPVDSPEQTAELHLEGTARIAGRPVIREAVPAEDLMQAFAYHHLVPADAWILSVAKPAFRRTPPSFALAMANPVSLPARGGTASVEFAGPPQIAWFFDQLDFELSEPPAGVSLGKVTCSKATLQFPIQLEAGKLAAGLEGNLIVQAFFSPTQPPPGASGSSSGGSSTPAPRPALPAGLRRVPIGPLPAIPFRVVGE